MIVHENFKDRTVVIATGSGITSTTQNRKTGDMIQLWILHMDIKPTDLVQSGIDAQTVCKGCPFASGGGCYVNAGQAPQSAWKAYKRGSYKDFNISKFKGKKVRFGAYGNPSLIPLEIIKDIVSVSSGHTGYFHDWHEMSNEQAIAYGQYFMASTETQTSFEKVKSLGLRVFHVSPIQPKGTIECLSDSHDKQCRDCMLCAGNSKKARSIWISPHGSKKAKAEAAAML
jgi:hypothetical protein